jgi:group I intron endonuclease
LKKFKKWKNIHWFCSRRRLYAYLNENDLISRKYMLINRAILKYSHSNFSLEIIEYCKVEDLVEREDHYIDSLKPEYNILQKAGSSLGYKHSEEAKIKMSALALGRKHSLETINKFSELRAGKNKTEEDKLAISLSQPSRIKIKVHDLQTNIETSYSSMRLVAKALNTRLSSIRSNLNSKKKNLLKVVIFLQ